MDEKKMDSAELELPTDFNVWDRTRQVEHLVTAILNRKKAFSQDKSAKANDIFKELKEIYPEHGIPINTFTVTLSDLAHSNTSPITKLPNRNGYFLNKELPQATKKEEKEKPEETGRIEREKILYQIFINWLRAQGIQQVKDTSYARNQDLGKWGNPDITGIKIHETIGHTTDIEIITIEVKPSLEDWKHLIFESVAHKRFANRSYFAFLLPEDELGKIDADMKNYAEIYGIGILILPVKKRIYDQIISNAERRRLPDDILSDYSLDDIVEVSSALYMPTHYHFRDRFLKALGITSEGELHRWGKD